jgi:hypothetical protein
MNNAIHVKIQVVKLWQESRVRDDLIDLGVSFTDPSIKLRNKRGKKNMSTSRTVTRQPPSKTLKTFIILPSFRHREESNLSPLTLGTPMM